jgi:antitoxin (DNA-binding transcriptional repressor) of toxin-antitoxin stability system
MKQVSIAQAQADLPDLVAQAAAGEDIMIMADGKPLVRLAAANDAAPQDRRTPVFDIFHDANDPSSMRSREESLRMADEADAAVADMFRDYL